MDIGASTGGFTDCMLQNGAKKVRVRSYGVPNDEDMVFVELKKKYKGVVYKRRIEMTLAQTRDFFAGKDVPHDNPQIENELKYFQKIR